MKHSFLLFTLLFAFNITQAQIKLGVEGGANYANLNNQENSQNSKLGWNINASAKYYMKNKFGIGLTSGIYHFNEANNSTITRKLNLIPILLSSEYNLSSKKLSPYIGLDLGAFIFNYKTEISDQYIVIDPSDSMYTYLKSDNSYQIKETFLKIGIVPSFGLRYNITKKISIDFNTKLMYVFTQNSNYININSNLGIGYFLK